MGRIIYPSGISAKNKKIKGSIPYHWIMRDILNEKFTLSHKTKLLNILIDIGILDESIITYLKKILNEKPLDQDFKISANKILEIYYRK